MSGFNSEDTAEEQLDSYLDALETLKKTFPKSKVVRNAVQIEQTLTKEWIEEHPSPNTSKSSREKIGNVDIGTDYKADRSVFDDIDQ